MLSMHEINNGKHQYLHFFCQSLNKRFFLFMRNSRNVVKSLISVFMLGSVISKQGNGGPKLHAKEIEHSINPKFPN
jgi:hypothetical protein